MEAITPGGPHSKPTADHNRFVLDLTEYERRRTGAVLDAMPDWDPAAVLAAETQPHARLYSGLDNEQRAVYDFLLKEGVLDAVWPPLRWVELAQRLEASDGTD